MVAILAFLLAVAPALAFADVIDVTVGADGKLLYSPENVVSINILLRVPSVTLSLT